MFWSPSRSPPRACWAQPPGSRRTRCCVLRSFSVLAYNSGMPFKIWLGTSVQRRQPCSTASLASSESRAPCHPCSSRCGTRSLHKAGARCWLFLCARIYSPRPASLVEAVHLNMRRLTRPSQNPQLCKSDLEQLEPSEVATALAHQIGVLGAHRLPLGC